MAKALIAGLLTCTVALLPFEPAHASATKCTNSAFTQFSCIEVKGGGTRVDSIAGELRTSYFGQTSKPPGDWFIQLKIEYPNGRVTVDNSPSEHITGCSFTQRNEGLCHRHEFGKAGQYPDRTKMCVSAWFRADGGERFERATGYACASIEK